MALGAVFHLNEAELCAFTRCEDVHQAAQMLHSLTRSDVIVTLGAEGAYVFSSAEGMQIPGFPAAVIDTVGAGDAHIGTIMACQAAGMPLSQAILQANRVSAAVVSHAGASLPEDVIARLIKESS